METGLRVRHPRVSGGHGYLPFVNETWNRKNFPTHHPEGGRLYQGPEDKTVSTDTLVHVEGGRVLEVKGRDLFFP